MPYPSKTIEHISEFIFIPDNHGEADLIFVMGSSYLPTMEAVAKLYHDFKAPIVLISGMSASRETHQDPTEAARFKERGLELGIPESSILIEVNATNTKENLAFSKEVLEKSGKLAKIKKVLFVCQSYHTRRVLMTINSVFGDSIIPLFHSVYDARNIHKENWWRNKATKDRVLDELRRIQEYTLKGDLSLTPY